MAEITSDYRCLDDLRPHARNPNLHTRPGAIEKMAQKIRFTAFTAPIIINPEGTILGGHLRRLGLLKLRSDHYPEPEGVQPGWKVPVRVFHGTEPQELQVVAGDNPDPADNEMDEAALAAILAELAEVGPEALAGAGYDEARLQELIDGLGAELSEEGAAGGSGLLPGADPDAVPEQVETRCRRGDLWRLGEHRLLCGDSTVVDDVARLMGGRKVDCMLTDPPYGLGDTDSSKNNYDLHEDTQENLKQIIAALFPLAKDYTERIVLTPGNANQRLYPQPAWTMAWFTPAGVGSGPWGFCCWQPILCYGKDPRLQHGEGRYPDALVHTEAAEKLGHPCSKPVKFWAWLMERVTAKGGDIFEPFGGSGTAFIAAEGLGRKCYGIELSPAYCDIILTRWEQATGRTAELLERADG